MIAIAGLNACFVFIEASVPLSDMINEDLDPTSAGFLSKRSDLAISFEALEIRRGWALIRPLPGGLPKVLDNLLSSVLFRCHAGCLW